MKEKTEVLLGAYRVLDLTDEKGFLCGKVLGDLGADVIKIEPPGGNPARNMGPFYNDIPDPEKSLYWFSYNANKRGITLNLEALEGQRIFRKLVKTADFVIESFDPGYMDRLGLGYQELHRIKPSLIMTSTTPFGQSGPYAHHKGSSLIAEAMAGLMYLTGYPDGTPCSSGIDYAYCHAGLQAAVGSLTAHYYRLQTGRGQHVDVSIQESVLVTLYMPKQFWDLFRIIQTRLGRNILRGKEIITQLLYPCKDGYVLWRLMTAEMGRGVAALVEWMDEEGLAGDLRGIVWEEVDMGKVTQEQLSAWERSFGKFFVTKTKRELSEESIKRNLSIFTVNTARDILEDSQLRARNFWTEVEHPELGTTLNYPGIPFTSTEVAFDLYPAPLIGEHNQEIYGRDLGFSVKEIAAFKERGVI